MEAISDVYSRELLICVRSYFRKYLSAGKQVELLIIFELLVAQIFQLFVIG